MNKYYKLTNILKESKGKIAKEVEYAGKKLGIEFKKITNDITTNKFSNPTGDVSKMGKDNERVRMNSWMADSRSGSDNITKQNVKEIGEKLIKLLIRTGFVNIVKYSGGFEEWEDKKSKLDITDFEDSEILYYEGIRYVHHIDTNDITNNDYSLIGKLIEKNNKLLIFSLSVNIT